MIYFENLLLVKVNIIKLQKGFLNILEVNLRVHISVTSQLFYLEIDNIQMIYRGKTNDDHGCDYDGHGCDDDDGRGRVCLRFLTQHRLERYTIEHLSIF